MCWYKLNYDGTILEGGDRVENAEFSLGPEGGPGEDGWCWFTTIEEAQVALIPGVVTPAMIFNALDPEKAQAVIDLATGLITRAGEVWTHTYDMPNDAPGKLALCPIAEAVLLAALPLL